MRNVRVCVRVLNGATVETVWDFSMVRPGLLSCISVDHVRSHTDIQFVCAQRKNTKTSSFVTRSDVSVLLLESQPSLRDARKDAYFGLVTFIGTWRDTTRSCRGHHFSFLGNGATRAASDRTDWWITAERKALGCVNTDNDFSDQ